MTLRTHAIVATVIIQLANTPQVFAKTNEIEEICARRIGKTLPNSESGSLQDQIDGCLSNLAAAEKLCGEMLPYYPLIDLDKAMKKISRMVQAGYPEVEAAKHRDAILKTVEQNKESVHAAKDDCLANAINQYFGTEFPVVTESGDEATENGNLEKLGKVAKGTVGGLFKKISDYNENDPTGLILQNMSDINMDQWGLLTKSKSFKLIDAAAGQTSTIIKAKKMDTVTKRAVLAASAAVDLVAGAAIETHLSRVPVIGPAAPFAADVAVKGARAVGVGTLMLGESAMESVWETYQLDKYVTQSSSYPSPPKSRLPALRKTDLPQRSFPQN